MPYEESLRLLKNTTNLVELTVSQIFSEYQRQMQRKSHDVRRLSENNTATAKMHRRSNSNLLDSIVANEYQWKKMHCSEQLQCKNEQDFNDKINNDNGTSCYKHDDFDNNNHEKDVTVLITNQPSKNSYNAQPKLMVNSISHFTDTQSFQKHGFNDIPQSSDALNCSHTEMSDNCLISANCMPDLPKVKL